MKNGLLIILFFLLSFFASNAQVNSYSRTIIDTLASKTFMGRGYTFEGSRKAAGFIEQQFESIGLKPVADNYHQPFLLDVNTFPDKMALSLGKTSLKPGIDFLICPDSPSIHGKFKTVAVSRSDLLIQKELKKLIGKMNHRILIIEDTMELDPEAMKKSEKIINAFRYDPTLLHAGVVLLTTKKLTWYVASYQAPRPCFIVKYRDGIFSTKSISMHIDAVLKKDHESNNVLGMIEGKVIPDSFLVVMAHYDHLGTMGSEVYFPGANDNASGVAMLLALARHFVHHPPDYSMVFIALGAEEAGLMGAKAFVNNPVVELEKMVFAINFDLAGTGDDGIKVVNATVFDEKFRRLQAVNSKHSLMESVQARGEACNSDHCMFYQAGVPCFYIYTLGGIAAYHDVFDKPETLPLTDFDDYFTLIRMFLETF